MNKTIRCGLLLTAVTLSCTAGFGQQPTLFTNNYDPKAEIPKLDAEKSVIYDPVRTWTYSHHPSVAFFKGTFYAVFSNGPEGEDECGQRIMLATSEDFTDWSEPRVILSPGEGEFGQTKILTPGGITVIGGKLTLYYTENDNDGVSNKRIKATLFAITSEDGRTWSEPVNLSIRVFPCHRPLTLSNGRIILTGNTLVYYTDDPSGTGKWNRCRMEVPKYQDGAVTFEQVHPSLCEGALFEHNDGQVFCLLRSTGKTYDGYLWQMQSTDGGISWTSPVKSRFTDNNTKSFFGNLPDGRYFTSEPRTLPVRENVTRWCWPSPKTATISARPSSSPMTDIPSSIKAAGKAAITAIRTPWFTTAISTSSSRAARNASK